VQRGRVHPGREMQRRQDGLYRQGGEGDPVLALPVWHRRPMSAGVRVEHRLRRRYRLQPRHEGVRRSRGTGLRAERRVRVRDRSTPGHVVGLRAVARAAPLAAFTSTRCAPRLRGRASGRERGKADRRRDDRVEHRDRDRRSDREVQAPSASPARVRCDVDRQHAAGVDVHAEALQLSVAPGTVANLRGRRGRLRVGAQKHLAPPREEKGRARTEPIRRPSDRGGARPCPAGCGGRRGASGGRRPCR